MQARASGGARFVSWRRGWTLAVLLAVAPTALAGPAEEARQIAALAGFHGGLVIHVGCGDGQLTAALRLADNCIVQGLETDAKRVEAAPRGHPCARTVRPGVRHALERKETPVRRQSGDAGGLRGRRRGRGRGNDARAPALRRDGGQAGRQMDGNASSRRCRRRRVGTALSRRGQQRRRAGHASWARRGDTSGWASRSGSDPTWRCLRSTAWSRPRDGCSPSRIWARPSTRRCPGKYALVARDAYNGVILWRVMFPDWHPIYIRNKEMPVQLQRRLAAVGDVVYCTPGYSAPITVFDAATGAVMTKLRAHGGDDGIRV